MIRCAQVLDLPVILEIYKRARAYMAETGNPNQWGTTSPAQEMIEQDIEEQKLYVYVNEDEIRGVFFFDICEDPTYAYIEDGKWISDEPYGVIHRIASSGVEKGVLGKCIDFCKQQTNHLRIDTHHDNKIMQHLVVKNGFERCGIIYIQDGSARIAYEYVK